MFAVGRIGSYISRGVYTVSGPFHPFGGAVDIIVVEQQDGSFKSTPWYVRFGKFQGVLKATERVVSINVNGVDADFHMYLDRQGEAFFLREVDAAEEESESYPYSADGMEMKSDAWGTQKSMSCNYEANAVTELEGSKRKSLTRNNSRREKIFGLPVGRRSVNENGFQSREASVEVDNISSLERAEIAADLLEVRWSTNLHTGKNQNPSASDEVKVNSSISSNGETNTQHSCSINRDNFMEFTPEKASMEADSGGVDKGSVNDDQTVLSGTSEVSKSVETPKNEDNASPVDAPLNKGCDTLENISMSDGNEETLSNAAEVKLGDELGTSQCSADKGLSEDIIVKKVVQGLHMENSAADKFRESLTHLLDESSSGELSAGTSYMNSILPVSEKECANANMSKSSLSSSERDSIIDSTESNNKLTPSHFSKEEQFVFSDLDDSEVEKVEHMRTVSSGSEGCLSQGSLDNSEVAVSDTIISNESHKVTMKPTQDNPSINHRLKLNSNRVSSPMSISKQHNDADEEALTPVAESLPNMAFSSNNYPINMSQPLGHSLDSTLDAFRMASNDVPVTPSSSAGKQQVLHSQFTTDGSQNSVEIEKIISDPAVEVSLCRHLLYDGMGYEAAACAFDSERLDVDKFLSLGPEILSNDKLVVRIGGLYFPWDAALPIASAIGSQGIEQVLEPKGMIAVGQVDNNNNYNGVAQKSINSQNGSWKIWPFSFTRSNSNMQCKSSSSETASESPREMVGDNGAVVPRATRKKIRTKMPSSEQLASLNLKEGKNVVLFTFSTAMLGEQQVDARIFLWKWNARIVISDVDGTITKSDVLGQFMPLMGMDWSQTGVAHLFSAIKENGYELVFLSARSISQAYHTRQFLINLKQDGKALPEGPVLISPDGLFPSLYREVIRRAPHEFKIACLEDVKVLFSADHNPFYAGFGNRDTDELSYLKMGIPRGKIFTINPKGQVVVNRRVDSKSYTSLHALVHDMFPPTTLHEQEDYNSWNFWRLPPPDGII